MASLRHEAQANQAATRGSKDALKGEAAWLLDLALRGVGYYSAISSWPVRTRCG